MMAVEENPLLLKEARGKFISGEMGRSDEYR